MSAGCKKIWKLCLYSVQNKSKLKPILREQLTDCKKRRKLHTYESSDWIVLLVRPYKVSYKVSYEKHAYMHYSSPFNIDLSFRKQASS